MFDTIPVMRDWRTTLSGLVTVAFGFVVSFPDLFAKWPWLVAFAKFAALGGLGTLGWNASDGKKTGT